MPAIDRPHSDCRYDTSGGGDGERSRSAECTVGTGRAAVRISVPPAAVREYREHLTRKIGLGREETIVLKITVGCFTGHDHRSRNYGCSEHPRGNTLQSYGMQSRRRALSPVRVSTVFQPFSTDFGLFSVDTARRRDGKARPSPESRLHQQRGAALGVVFKPACCVPGGYDHGGRQRRRTSRCPLRAQRRPRAKARASAHCGARMGQAEVAFCVDTPPRTLSRDRPH